MTLQLSVKADIKEVTRYLSKVQRSVVPKATASALNKTATQVKTGAARAISKHTGMKVEEVKKKLIQVRASRGKLAAAVIAQRHAPNLIRYAARQTKKGVSAAPWRKRRVFKGTFMANAGRTVFKRVGKARLPIKPVYGPSLPNTFVKKEIMGQIKKIGRDRFLVNFNRDLNFFLRRVG